jgi:hypothetical protein
MIRLVAIAVALTVTVASVSAAQQGGVVQEQKPGMLREAKVTPDSARKVALSQFPDAEVVASRIESGTDGLVYWFNLVHRNMTGNEQTEVDARTGKFLRAWHNGAGPDFRQQSLGSKSPELHPEINAALLALDNARVHLERADKDFGGHREQALKLVNEAMQQLKLAVEFDRH